MDFYVDVNGTVYPDTDGLEKVQSDIKALFEDPSFGIINTLTDHRKDMLNQQLRKFLWEALPDDLQLKVGYPTVVLNEDNTFTFKFYLRTCI